MAYAPPSASAAPSVALAPAPRTSRATRSHRSRSSPPKIEGARPFHPYLSSRSSSTSISGNTVATTPLTSNHVATCPSAEYFDAIRRIDFASSSSASAAAVVSACGTMENELEGSDPQDGKAAAPVDIAMQVDNVAEAHPIQPDNGNSGPSAAEACPRFILSL